MHGEMHQACSILVAAQQALRTGAPFMYEAPQYESSTVFHFRSRSWLRGSKTYLVGNVSEWFGRCLTKGLSDVQYLTDTMPDNRDLLGFANASPNLLACFFRNGRVRLFGSCWLFDPQSRGWNVVYMEARKSGIFKRKLAWEDNTENFRQALVRIEAFARQIGCDDFAEIFFRAQAVLDGEAAGGPEPSLALPEHNRRLFEAAGVADVFGGMGSWNDSPAGIAEEQGQKECYDKLSQELLQQIRSAVLYAVNEW